MSIVLTLVPFKSGGLCYHFSLIASCYLMSKNKNKKFYFNDKDWIFKHFSYKVLSHASLMSRVRCTKSNKTVEYLFFKMSCL